MSATIRDPKGNRLRLVLMQVTDSDARGPIALRIPEENETIDIAADRHRQFFMVWTTEDSALAITTTTKLVDELDAAVAARERAAVENIQLAIACGNAERARDALEAEVREKTAALRELQRERDPARVEALVAERIANATHALERNLAAERVTSEALRREVDELRVSKRKLREALERAKERR